MWSRRESSRSTAGNCVARIGRDLADKEWRCKAIDCHLSNYKYGCDLRRLRLAPMGVTLHTGTLRMAGCPCVEERDGKCTRQHWRCVVSERRSSDSARISSSGTVKAKRCNAAAQARRMQQDGRRATAIGFWLWVWLRPGQGRASRMRATL